MTSPGAGGATHLGTVTGSVRINYETSSVRSAISDVESFQASLQAVSDSASDVAKDVDRTGGVVTQFGRMLDKLSQKEIPNPAKDLGKRVENETDRAAKAIAGLQKQTAKVGTNLKVTPNNIKLERGALEAALRGARLQRVRVEAPITLVPSVVTVNRNAFIDAVQNVDFPRVTVRIPIHVEASDVTVDADAVGDAVQQQAGSGSGLGGGRGGGLLSALPLLGKVTAAATSAAAAVGGVGFVLGKGFSRLEQIDQATAKLSAMGLKLGEIQAISQASLKSVEGTAFGLNEAFNTAADAINAGIKPGEQLNKYLNATANTAALAGVGMQELGQAFSQAAIEGKLTGDVFQLLVSRQVPVLKNLSEEYGVTQQKAREMISNGEITFDRFLTSMSKSADAARGVANTISGSFSNLGAAVSRLGANILAPLFAKENADDANILALAIQKVTDWVDSLGNTLKEHKAGVVTFWEVFAKGGLIIGKIFTTIVGIVSDAVVKVTEILGDAGGWITRFGATLADVFGADGVADNLNEVADKLHDLGSGLRETRDSNMGKLNRTMDNLWKSTGEWADKARNASGAAADMGASAGQAVPNVISLKDALEALKIKADSAEEAMMGTNEQFKDFLEKVKEAGGSEELIKKLVQIRSQFENGGRAVKNFASAIDALKDSTVSATDKANRLIEALKGYDMLPGGEALSSYNKTFAEMTSYMSDIIDMSDTMGDALAGADGTLNLNSKNAQNILDTIGAIRREMVALIASGEASPDEAYGRTVEGLQDVLIRQAGLSPAMAQKVIEKYLPKDALLEAFKRQNPKEVLESLFKNDPARLQTELNLLTTTQDILGKVVGPDGALHIPTVLDTSTPVPPAEPPSSPPATTAPPAPEGSKLKPGAQPFIGPVPVGSKDFVSVDGKTYRASDLEQPQKVVNPVQIAQPNMLPPGPGTSFLDNAAGTRENASDLADLANNKELLTKALTEHPDIKKALEPLIQQAEAQGQNFGIAFAQGIMMGSDEVRAALQQLAQLAGDYLGNSPAKYGPLSGKGWTLFRGKTFTSDWAKGIASEASRVEGAVKDTATAAVTGMAGGGMTLNDSMSQLLGDLQAWSDIGKRLLEFGNQMSDITFKTLRLFNDLSGGALFPKSYIKDLTRQKNGSALGGWNPQGWTPPKEDYGYPAAAALGNVSGGAGKAVPIVQKADGTWTSPDPEWAKLIQRESGGNPSIVQQIKDANSGGNEASGLFQIAKGTWASNGGLDYAPEARFATPQQQAEIAARIFNSQGGSPWGSGKNPVPGRESEDLLRAGLTGVYPATPTGAKPLPDVKPTDSKAMVDVITPGGPIKARADVAKRMVDTGAWTYANTSQETQKASGTVAFPAGGSQNTNSALGFLEQIAASQFGLKLTSGKRNWAGTTSGKSWHLSGEAGDFAVPGVQVPTANKRAFAEYVRDNFAPFIQELIYSDQQGGVNLFQGQPHQYSADTLKEHENHVHVAVRNEMIEALRNSILPGGLPAGNGALSAAQAVPVSLSERDRKAVDGIWNNTNGMPSMPSKLQDLIGSDPVLRDAMMNQSKLTEDTVIPVLQQLDTRIAEQNRIGTPESKALANQLGQYKGQLQNQFGLQEGPTALDQAEGIANGVSSIASSVFGLIDQTITSVGAIHDIGNTLTRGIANTEDISKTIDNIQEFVTLFQRGAQLVSDVTGLAASITGAAAAGDTSGGTQGAAMALGAASAIAGITSQVAGAINAAIDIGQEVYGIVTTHVGRFIQAWTGLTGASDVRYLLDTVTGQVHAYSSDNPNNKTTFNTLGRAMGNQWPDRPTVVNNNVVYQGPGQDPRDTMDDMMFSIRASGQGAFGYAV